MQTAKIVDWLLGGVMALAAVLIAVSMVHREFFSSVDETAASHVDRKINTADWDGVASSGIRLDRDSASATLVVFVDFQCPFCAAYHSTLERIITEFPTVQLVVQHFPLPMHPYAVEAAVASECADEQEKFWQFTRELYSDQQNIGSRPWTEFAAAAGVSDLAEFEQCTGRDAAAFERINAGQRWGNRLGIPGTPTAILDGVMLARPPAPADILEYISSEPE